jgi:hypothetical protein
MPDSFFPPQFLASLPGPCDFISSTFNKDESGAGWGALTLMPGSEKPPRYTDRFH